MERSIESLAVTNHDDGTMTIVCRIVQPPTQIPNFESTGTEAIKRYQAWILMTAAGMVFRNHPKLARDILRVAQRMGHPV